MTLVRVCSRAGESIGSENRCLPKARSRALRVGLASAMREWPEKWMPAHASKAACANQLPAWLSVKRTAAFG
jgi:hypothetical protein